MGKINSNKKAILITGTIVPNSVFVAHTNIEQRKQEYIEGLLFYKAQFPNDDIFFLENSTHDFTTDSQFSDLFKKHHITLIKFPKILVHAEINTQTAMYADNKNGILI